ncbi:prepilin-type N-terminal cleavage/methylation domain-containing protein [bacterium]|nr:prepilin-type N-terminal cleavage/methylation domain-containing protein [bacterium]
MKKRRGVSLIELIMSLFLISLLTVLAFVNINQHRSKYPCQALADTVAEQLRLARQTAISEQQPVAIGIPSGGGTIPVSQSIYWATGHSMARVTKVLDFSSSYPGQVLFEGSWAAGDGIFPRTAGGSREAFVAAPWLLNPHMGGYQMPLDYCLVFTPDGGVTSNGMPVRNGAYHIVVAAGAAYTPARVPPVLSGSQTSALNYFQANVLGTPYQVEVMTTGAVRVVQGLAQAFNTNEQPVAAVAPAPPVMDLPAADPQSAGAVILPKPTSYIPGVNVTLVAGQRVTMAVNATDASGHDIFVEWKAQRDSGNTSASNGTFSMLGSQPMTWDAKSRQWMSSWDWVCPLDAGVNDRFAFTCEFGDGSGRVMPGPAGPTALSIAPSPKIYYECAASSGSSTALPTQIVEANCDGSFPRVRVRVSTRWPRELSLSRQGTLLYFVDRNVYSTQTGQIVGTFLHFGWGGPAPSPDGNWEAVDGVTPGGDLAAVSAHPIKSSVLTPLVATRTPLWANVNWTAGLVSGAGFGRMYDYYIWSPDQRHLSYINGDGIHILDLLESGTGLTVTADRAVPGTTGFFRQHLLTWKPDSTGFYFSCNGGPVTLADTATLTATAQPQLNAFSQAFLDGINGVTSQAPASDGGTCRANQASLSPAGDKFYMIDSNGKLSTVEVATGAIQTLCSTPKGVQAWRVVNP